MGVVMLGLTVALYLYNVDKYSLIYFGDSVSHMVGARKVVDWADPGLHQIGTVWLPLPHIMLLPFTLIDSLFTTGFAGLVVSLPCLATTAVLLYKMAGTHWINGLGYIAFLAALLYATNPNILYLSLTAMTEAPLMLFFVAAAYFLQKWYKEPEQVRSLALSAVFVALATLCRYEGWILPLFLVPFAVAFALGNNKVRDSQKRTIVVLLSLVSFAGIIFWLAYNQYRYGDALEFANAEFYSASSQALNRDIRETLFLQPANVMSVYGATIFVVYGPVLLASALIGYVLHRRKKGSKDRRMLYLFLALPPLFTIITLLIGIGEMTFWFNSRFVILLAPLAVVLTIVFLRNLPDRVKKTRGLVAAVIGVLFLFQIGALVFGTVPTFLDARGGFFYNTSPFAAQVGEALGSMYDDGQIMIVAGSAQDHKVMVTSGISLRQFDEIIQLTMSKQSFYEPWSYSKWIVMGKEPDADAAAAYRYWQDRRDILDDYYAKVYENESYEILALKQ